MLCRLALAALACTLALGRRLPVELADEGRIPRRQGGLARQAYTGMRSKLMVKDEEDDVSFNPRRRGGQAPDDEGEDYETSLPRRSPGRGHDPNMGRATEGMGKRQAASFERWRRHEQQRRRAAHLLHEQNKVQMLASTRATTGEGMSDCPDRCSMRGTCVDGECLCDYPYSGLECRDIVGACVDDCTDHGVCADGECICDRGWDGIDCSVPEKCPDNCNGHGICVDSAAGGGVGAACECDPHYEGPSCATFTGACLNDCWARGRCEGSTCYCDVGWTGADCSMSTKCPRNCSAHGVCNLGVCACDSGWMTEDCSVPVPALPVPCPDNCTDHDHGICGRDGVCVCKNGYEGIDCSQMPCPNDCSGHGGCDHSDGVCTCDEGWSKADCSYAKCPGTPECTNHGVCINGACNCNQPWGSVDCSVMMCPPWPGNDCSNHGTCDSATGTCDCQYPFIKADCSEALCPRQCSNHGDCDKSTGTCTCHPPWVGEDCGTPLCPRNCSGHGRCNMAGTCECAFPWTTLDCSVAKCPKDCSNRGTCNDVGVCDCAEPFVGADCSGAICPNGCSNNGLCSNLTGECSCFDGFRNTDCSKRICPGEDPATGNPCSNHGSCDDLTGKCTCEDTHYGSACEFAYRECPVKCSGHGDCDRLKGACSCDGEGDTAWKQPDCALRGCPLDCSSRGTCDGREGKCTCDEGFYNDGCELMRCPQNCNGHGECNTKTGVCTCDPPWTGEACLSASCPTNEGGVSCNNHGQCDATNGVCVCDEGWLGVSCSIGVCPKQCSQRGTCNTDTAVCTCDDPWYGPSCSSARCPADATGVECGGSGVCDSKIGVCACNPGFAGPACDNQLCGPPCRNGGMCENGVCTCPAGYSGVDCSIKECDPPCQHGGVCENGVCKCPAGFSGVDCSDRECDPPCLNGMCDPKTGKCMCPAGYSGVDCSTKDCVRPCVNGQCVNGVCLCPAGYSGADCSIKACDPPCQNGGVCENGVCKCPAGFSGVDCSGLVCNPPCKHGKCAVGPSGLPVCQCPAGFSGVDCSIQACDPTCVHGECDNGVCKCPEGFIGPDCSSVKVVRPEPRCGGNLMGCSGHGTCVRGICRCESSWYGVDCNSWKCYLDCSGHGICNKGQGCTCTGGWKGRGCENRAPSASPGPSPVVVLASESPEPSPSSQPSPSAEPSVSPPESPLPTPPPVLECDPPCQNGGVCENGVCQCPAGFGGVDCSTKLCDPPCERGECINGVCACPAGWGGPTCSEELCDPPCERGDCVDGQCVCPAGWGGVDCSEALCDPSCERGTCVDGVCQCPPGWAGATCHEHLCDPPCVRGDCVDGQCVCPAGWSGADCSLQQCDPPCTNGGVCQNGQCACPAGYFGPDCSSMHCPGWTGTGTVQYAYAGQNAAQFTYDDTPRNYADAAAHCLAAGGVIASIHSDSEFSQVKAIVAKTAYLGARADGAGTWTWDDGTNWDYVGTSGDSQREGYGLRGEEETRLAYQVGEGDGYDGMWHDWKNGEAQLGVVCRFNLEGEGQQLTLTPGDVVKVLEQGAAGDWCKGETQDGVVGYYPTDYVTINDDDGVECTDHGTCDFGAGVCTCNQGWKGDACHIPVKSCPRECMQRGRCDDGACICNKGYTGDACQHIECDPSCVRGECVGGQCVCEAGWTGPDCSVLIPKLCPMNCSNAGDCDGATGECDCDAVHTGPACSKLRCVRNCTGHGTCDKETDQCNCYDGWTEDDCSVRMFCPGPNCSNHGDCNMNTGTCTCFDPAMQTPELSPGGGAAPGADLVNFTWDGEACELAVCHDNCSMHGTCVGGVNDAWPRCDCEEGWGGAACETFVNCPLFCSGKGLCDEVTGTCDCIEGFKGTEHCGVPTYANPCMTNCTGHGICVDGACECEAGYGEVDCSSNEDKCPGLGTCSGRGSCMPSGAGVDFQVDNGALTYSQAVDQCVNVYNATIASIHSDHESARVLRMLTKTSYLGGRSDGSGVWSWDDGSPWDYTPDTTGDGLKGIQETRLAFQVNEGDGLDNTWHDWKNGEAKLGAVCRRPYDSPHCRCHHPYQGDGCGKVFTSDETLSAMTDRSGGDGALTTVVGCPAGCSEHGTCMDDGTCDCFGFENKEAAWWVNGEEKACEHYACPFNCSWPNGRCDRLEDRIGCICHPGWIGKFCQHPMECRCVPGKGTCNCSKAYVAEDGTTVCGCDCEEGWTGDDCSIRQPCPKDEHDNECSLNGACWLSKCLCDAGWTGDSCDTKWYPLNLNQCEGGEDNECNRHGVCQHGLCECLPGWTGYACETAVEMCPGLCSGHGVCVDGKCQCEKWWFGEACELSDSHVVDPGTFMCENAFNCSGNGYCRGNTCPWPTDPKTGIGRCACADGFAGATCGGKWPVCLNRCSGHGRCVADGECDCLNGYSGMDCSLEHPNLPVTRLECPDQCNGRGVCDDMTGRCQCELNWEGSACEFYVDACIDHCSGAGICEAGGLCRCAPGNEGESCFTLTAEVQAVDAQENALWDTMSMRPSDPTGRALVPLDDAGAAVKVLYDSSACPNNCSSRGLCTVDGCVCMEGYTGHNCATVDLCCVQHCSGQGICMDGLCVCRWDVGTDDSLKNALPRGFLGAYYSKEEIDEMDPDEMRGVLRKATPGVFTETQLQSMSVEQLREELNSRVTQLPDATSINPDMAPPGRPVFTADPTPRNYADSVAFCASHGATIASVHDDTDNAAAVAQVVVSSYLGAGSNGKGVWRWDDGSQWDYTPASADGWLQGVDSTRLSIRAGVDDGADGQWREAGNGDELLGVVCRRETAPPGETPDCHIEPPDVMVDPICDLDCHNCTGHGICMNNAVCMCHPDWVGDCCDKPNIPCPGDGTCNAPTGQCVLGVCVCAPGYTGETCEINVEDQRKEAEHDGYVNGLRDSLRDTAKACLNGCSNNGVCDFMTGLCTCFGPSKAPDCSDGDGAFGDCAFNCSGHGLCVRGECHCYPGHVGEGCEIYEIKCPGLCSGQGMCLDGVCHCVHGFTGPSCDQRIGSVDGTGSVGFSKQMKPCPRNCSQHGRCSGGRCHCPCGQHGDACEVTDGMCVHSCTGRGACSLRTGECTCSPGYFGPDCSVRSLDPIQLDCIDDAGSGPLATLAPGEMVDVICPPGCQMAGGTIYGTGTYTQRSRICKSAYHNNVLPMAGGLVTITVKRSAMFAGSAAKGVTSESDHTAARAFSPSSPWSPGVSRSSSAYNVTCDTTGVSYRAMMLGYTIDLMCPPMCADGPVPIYGSQESGGYADHSGICKAGVQAGIITNDLGGMVVLKTFPKHDSFPAHLENDVQSQALESYDERTFLFSHEMEPSPQSGHADPVDMYTWWDTISIKTPNDLCPGNCSCKGTCTVDGTCLCDAGSYGPDCSISPGSCQHINHCSGQGLCEVVECHCGEGFSGRSCEEPAYSIYCTMNCTGHGQCIRGVCHCYTGWAGAVCDEMVLPCWPPCNENQTCQSGQCLCLPGYTGPSCDELGTDILSLEAHVCRVSAGIANMMDPDVDVSELVPGYDIEAVCDARKVCMLTSIKDSRQTIYDAMDDPVTPMGMVMALKDLVESCTSCIYYYFDGFLTHNVRLLRDQIYLLVKELTDLDPTVYHTEVVSVDDVVRYWGQADNVKLMLRAADKSGVDGAADLVSKIKSKRDALAEATAMAVAKLLNASATLDNGPHPLATMISPVHDSTLPARTTDDQLSLTCKATAASWEYRSLTGLSEDPVDVACPPGCMTPGKGGPVWGTGVYTDDSSICLAAVHAGLIPEGEGGALRVRLVQGRPRYTGSARNDVTSLSHAVWIRAMVLCPAGSSDDAVGCSSDQQIDDGQQPVAMAGDCGAAVSAKDLDIHDGTSITVLCSPPCVDEGVVWGSDVYTDDSAVCKAAVHAGVVTTEEGGAVLVQGRGSSDSFPSTAKNGVVSAEYIGAWAVTYSVVAGDSAARVPEGTVTCLTTGKASLLSSLQEHESAVVTCPPGCGSGSLRLWGTDVYTDDSKVCQAAVHAGVINQQGGTVRVTILPGMPMYRGSEHHGVRSMGYLAYSRSFQVSGVVDLSTSVSMLQVSSASKNTVSSRQVDSGLRQALLQMATGQSPEDPASQDFVKYEPDVSGSPPCLVEGVLRIGIAYTATFEIDYAEIVSEALAKAAGGDTVPADKVKLPSIRPASTAGFTLVDYQILVEPREGEVGSEFVADATPRTYSKAAAYCITIGARIASIHSEVENRRARSKLTVTSYLGARSDGKGVWSWDDGSLWDYVPAQLSDTLKGIDDTRLAFQVGEGDGLDDMWHDWLNGEAELGVLCRRPATATMTVDRARGVAGAVNLYVDGGDMGNSLVEAGVPAQTSATSERKAVATCPGPTISAVGGGKKTDEVLRALADAAGGSSTAIGMWTGFDEATIKLSNGMSIRELVEAVSDQMNLDEMKKLIALSTLEEERDAVQELIGSADVLAARGANECPDSNLMYALRIRIKQAAIDMYRLDPSSIQNPRQLTPSAITEAVAMPSTKKDLRDLAEVQPSLKKSIDVLISAVNAYLAAQSLIIAEVRVLGWEIRQSDETMVPDVTKTQPPDVVDLAKNSPYNTYLATHRNNMQLTAPGTQHAVELLLNALRTLAGALPFNPVNYGDLHAQRLFTLDTADQMRILGETEAYVEGAAMMTTLKLSKIYNDPDMELTLRVIGKNVLSSQEQFPNRDLSAMTREDLVDELTKFRMNGKTDAQIASMSMEELQGELRTAADAGGDEAVARSKNVAQLALDCISSTTALDDLVRAAKYYLTLTVDQLSLSEPKLIMASGLNSEVQMHCVFAPKIYPWLDRLAGESSLLSVEKLNERIGVDSFEGRTLETPMLATVLKSVTVGLTGTVDEENLRRSAQEPLGILLELVTTVSSACPQLFAGQGKELPLSSTDTALTVRDMVRHGLTGGMQQATSEANPEVPLECRKNVQRMSPSLATVRDLQDSVEVLLLTVAIEVLNSVPTAVPSLQGVNLVQDNVVKLVGTAEVVQGLLRYLDRVDTCSQVASFNADPHGVMQTESDILAFRLLNLIILVDGSLLAIPCPGDSDLPAGSAQCSGNGICVGGTCMCFSPFGGPDCRNRRTTDEVFDDGFKAGLEAGMTGGESSAVTDVIGQAAVRISGCGDAVKRTTKELSSLNPRCGDVWASGRLSPLEILDKLEAGEWVDELRLCAAGDGASNVTAFRHLVPRLLLEGATLRREVEDMNTMMKQLLITAVTQDCKVADYLQYDLKIESVPCHERSNELSSMKKDDVGAVVATKGSLGQLQKLLRVDGTMDLKSTVDNLIEIVAVMIKLGPCLESCNAQGDCVEAVCMCDPGFKGPSCAQEVPLLPGECLRNCSRQGDCVDGQCVCYDGWKGMDCSVSNVCLNDCSGHGDCIDGVCECFRRWRGQDCSKPREICPDDYKCYQGTCVRGTCECFQGWTGDDCTIGDFYKDHPPFKDPNEAAEDAFMSLLQVEQKTSPGTSKLDEHHGSVHHAIRKNPAMVMYVAGCGALGLGLIAWAWKKSKGSNHELATVRPLRTPRCDAELNAVTQLL